MSRTLHARWHVTPLSLPQVQRHCSTCGVPRPFRCGGKVRLNANGRKLDAWLIYKCAACDRTWNLPLLDRVPVAQVSATDLAAMQSSDPAWITPRAFDLTALRRHGAQVLLPTELAVTKALIGPGVEDCSAIELEITAPWPTGQRFDRFLAAELCLSRSALQAWQRSGALCILQGPRQALRLPLAGRVVLHLDPRRIAGPARAELPRAFAPPPQGTGS